MLAQDYTKNYEVNILTKRNYFDRFYRIIDRSDYDSEVIEHFKELDVIIAAPWDADQYIMYIGKGKPKWSKFLHDLKVVSEEGETMKPNCITRGYADTATLSKSDQDKRLKINLGIVQRMAKHLEPISGLPINRNTIMVAVKKNKKYCKGGISGYHIAHYHYTKPHRICFRPMFLINPVLPTQQKCQDCNQCHIRYMLTCDRKWFKLSPTPKIRRRVSEALSLIDCLVHELAHHGTKGHYDPDFQKKYLLLFSTMLNDIISGKYYVGRIN